MTPKMDAKAVHQKQSYERHPPKPTIEYRIQVSENTYGGKR